MNLHTIISTLQDPELAEVLESYIRASLPEFKQVLADHPIKKPHACISVCEAFWLYCLARDLKPNLIVESGTFEGFSLYFLRRACPAAELHCFDPGYKPVDGLGFEFSYHDCDWTSTSPMRFGPGTLVFFDDHINQDQRMSEAHSRGFQHVVFHDNYRSMKHSHVPLSMCDLKDAELVYTFERIRSDPAFVDTVVNPQTYRWLTYVECGKKHWLSEGRDAT